MKVMRNDKKAAVEMSLNLIIMLIIGIVVLGLVIGFVNNLVSQGKETYTAQLNDNEKLKLEEVERCSENLCIIPDPSVDLEIGERINIFLKVRAFSDEISCNAGLLDGSCAFNFKIVDSTGNKVSDVLTLSGPGFEAKKGESDAKMYTLTVTSEANVGTYFLTLKLYPDEDYEETKTITVNVE